MYNLDKFLRENDFTPNFLGELLILRDSSLLHASLTHRTYIPSAPFQVSVLSWLPFSAFSCSFYFAFYLSPSERCILGRTTSWGALLNPDIESGPFLCCTVYISLFRRHEFPPNDHKSGMAPVQLGNYLLGRYVLQLPPAALSLTLAISRSDQGVWSPVHSLPRYGSFLDISKICLS